MQQVWHSVCLQYCNDWVICKLGSLLVKIWHDASVWQNQTMAICRTHLQLDMLHSPTTAEESPQEAPHIILTALCTNFCSTQLSW